VAKTHQETELLLFAIEVHHSSKLVSLLASTRTSLLAMLLPVSALLMARKLWYSPTTLPTKAVHIILLQLRSIWEPKRLQMKTCFPAST